MVLVEKRPYSRFISLSILFHLLLVALFLFLEKPLFVSQPPIAQNKPVQWIELKELPKMHEPRSKQIAHTEEVNPTKKAAANARLGKINQIVEKESQARDLGVFESAKGKGGEDLKQAEKGEQKAPTTLPANRIKLSSLGIASLKRGAVVQARAPATKSIREGQNNKTSNWFQDVAIGGRTLLNTRQFVFYGFYMRVQEQFEQHWRELVQEKADQIYKRGDKLLSGRDHITRVKVVLDENGKLMNVFVQASSGQTEIDQAAVEAFKRAAQFPHPPKGLLQNGQVLLEWTFNLRT